MIIRQGLAVLVVLASGNAAASARTSPAIAYQCDGGKTASARYNMMPGGGVVVTIDGQVLTLQSDVSGSGARYTTKNDPHSITPLEWWNKGRGATLSELATRAGVTNRIISTCHQIP